MYKQFIQDFAAKRDKYGVTKSFVEPRWAFSDQTFYQLALMELGVSQCSDNEIFPAIFGESYQLVQLKCKNSYYGFDFCYKFLLSRVSAESESKGETKCNTLLSVINNERQTWERYREVDLAGLINRRLSEKQLVHYTALGLILFNDESKDFEPNPLFLTDEQYSHWMSPSLVFLTNVHAKVFLSEKAKSSWPVIKKGAPQATDTYSVEALSQMGYVGMYRGEEIDV